MADNLGEYALEITDDGTVLLVAPSMARKACKLGSSTKLTDLSIIVKRVRSIDVERASETFLSGS